MHQSPSWQKSALASQFASTQHLPIHRGHADRWAMFRLESTILREGPYLLLVLLDESALILSISTDKFQYLWKPTLLVKVLWTSLFLWTSIVVSRSLLEKAPICYENLLFVESALTLSKSADKFKYLWKPTPLVKDLWTSIVDTIIVNITHTFDPFIILDFDN